MVATLYVFSALLLQAASTWDLRSMLGSMSKLALAVVVILFILSIYSFGVMIDRALMYSAARKQSRVFVQQVAGALKEGKLDEAIAIPNATRKATSPRLSPPASPSFNPLPSKSRTPTSLTPPSAVSNAPSPSSTRK
jgi:hypothetical protein